MNSSRQILEQVAQSDIAGEVAQHLCAVQEKIKALFEDQAFEFTSEERRFFDRVRRDNNFFMVRSTGIEDGQNAANAGGNASIAYVKPDERDIQKAMGEVVASYFGAQSLKNRKAGGENLAETPLCLPVLIQVLIGERDEESIPVSGVAYSTNPALSDQNFSVAEINAAYGHGEGVVANRVQSDRFYLIPSTMNPHEPLIFSQIFEKKFRLVPVQQDDIYTLTMKNNISNLSLRPALSEEQLKALYKAMKTIETAYGYAVDIEFVVKDSVVYIVQVRPAMHSVLAPSYSSCDDENRAIVKNFSCIPIVPGSLSATVAQPQDCIIKQTLDEADQAPNSNQAKVVLVGAWASSLSHAAVNFMSHSIPCVFVPEYQALKQCCDSWKESYRLIIDLQKRVLIVWDTQISENYPIAQGWYQIPVNASFSYDCGALPLSEQKILPIDHAMIKACNDLFSATAGNEKAYLEKLNDMVNTTIRISKKRLALIAPHVGNALQYEQLVSEIEARWHMIHNEYMRGISQGMSQLHKLFLQSVIRSMIYPEGMEGMVGVYRLYDALNEGLIKQVLCRYKKQFKQSLFSEEFSLAEYAPFRELQEMWKRYISSLENEYKNSLNVDDRGLADRFKCMVQEIHALGYFPLWLMTDFSHAIKSEKSPSDVMRMLCDSHYDQPALFSRAKKLLTRNQTQEVMNSQRLDFITGIHAVEERLKSIRNRISFCSDLISWQQLEQELETILQELYVDFANQYQNTDVFGKLAACSMLSLAVDIMDTLIKSMKMSSLPFDEKKDNFKLMIERFYNFTEFILVRIMPESALKYHSSYSLNNYLRSYQYNYNRYHWDDVGEEIFKKSARFSVNAAVLGASTAFDRHLPRVAEDCFMLMHQNALVGLAGTIQSVSQHTSTSTIFLPHSLKSIMDVIHSNDMIEVFRAQGCARPRQIGIEYNADGIVVIYNISLRNHSSRLLVRYDKQTDGCRIEIQMVGESRERWHEIYFFAHMTPILLNISLDAVNFDEAGGCVTTCWQVNHSEDIEKILRSCAWMGLISFEHSLSLDHIKNLMQKDGLPEASINALISGSLQSIRKLKNSSFDGNVERLEREMAEVERLAATQDTNSTSNNYPAGNPQAYNAQAGMIFDAFVSAASWGGVLALLWWAFK